MEKPRTLEEFYALGEQTLPGNLQVGIGHFNVFKLDEFAGPSPKPMPFNRRDYFKISLVKGKSRVHYADKVVDVDKQVMVFSNPQIPYNWERIDEQLTGYFCVFTDAFFYQYSKLLDYSIFKPGGDPVFELTDEQVARISEVYVRMFEEINSEYAHKYDVLRNLTMELIHFAMKLQPTNLTSSAHSNAAERITAMFMELLERQFPIASPMGRVKLRTPAEFAQQLGIHVNHLNRALKQIAQKSTSDLIAERIMKEAKILIRHTHWNISEISYSLGFEETAHFSNFFKKNGGSSPSSYRKAVVV